MHLLLGQVKLKPFGVDSRVKEIHAIGITIAAHAAAAPIIRHDSPLKNKTNIPLANTKSDVPKSGCSAISKREYQLTLMIKQLVKN